MELHSRGRADLARSGRIHLWTLCHGLELGARVHRIALFDIPALSLASDQFLAELDVARQRFGLDASRLFFRDRPRPRRSVDLERARAFAEWVPTALGRRVVLDDFGNGFGAFTCLDRLCCSGEAEDHGRFVGRVVSDEVDRRIVSAIVAVARGFGARTVADGADDEVCGSCWRSSASTSRRDTRWAPFVIGNNWHRARPEVRQLSP